VDGFQEVRLSLSVRAHQNRPFGRHFQAHVGQVSELLQPDFGQAHGRLREACLENTPKDSFRNDFRQRFSVFVRQRET
jgi:hypothetical protein